MKQTRELMGMPITVEIVDDAATPDLFDRVYDYFVDIDTHYSPYKPTSEVSRINAGLPEGEWSAEMKRVLALCEATKQATKGYFDVWRDGHLDPSGLVKGWAINQAAAILRRQGIQNFYVEAGGDIQAGGHNTSGQAWRVGLRNPFNRHEIIKTLAISTEGVATSGTYIRGQHIYDPHQAGAELHDVASLTVVGPNIYEADRFATAAFAMGARGIHFIEQQPGLEGYQVDPQGRATFTSGLDHFVVAAAS
jgi:thiamine biosynthesis lipoprotein